MEITKKALHELFDYANGNLFWKVQKAKRIKIGSMAGSINKNGYISIVIDNKNHSAHRLIYMYFNEIPDGCCIDHADGNRLNNKIENLRIATQKQNSQNSRKRKQCTSQYKGVSKRKNSSTFVCQIRINGKQECLGYFCDELEAAKKYDQKAKEYFGAFAKTNFN